MEFTMEPAKALALLLLLIACICILMFLLVNEFRLHAKDTKTLNEMIQKKQWRIDALEEMIELAPQPHKGIKISEIKTEALTRHPFKDDTTNIHKKIDERDKDESND